MFKVGIKFGKKETMGIIKTVYHLAFLEFAMSPRALRVHFTCKKKKAGRIG